MLATKSNNDQITSQMDFFPLKCYEIGSIQYNETKFKIKFALMYMILPEFF